MQPLMDFSDQRPVDTLTLALYPSDGPAEYLLYEDDGATTAYENGKFGTTRISEHPTIVDGAGAMKLTVGPCAGSFDGKLARRTYRLEVHRALRSPSGVTRNNIPMVDEITVEALHGGGEGFAWDSTSRVLVVQFSGSTDSAFTVVARNFRTAGTTDDGPLKSD